MSKFEFKLPDIGEGVNEGEIVNWLIQEGDSVSEDQEMVEVMTDKATVTIGAPKPGKVVELRGKVGEVVPVGNVLVVFDLSDGVGKPDAAPAATPEPETVSPRASEPRDAAPPVEVAASAVGDLREQLPGVTPPKRPGDYFNEKPLAAPATRKFARESGIDLRMVEPTGPAQRVTREDLERYRSQQGRGKAPGRPAPVADEAPIVTPPPAALRAETTDQRVKVLGLRRRIFENMARAKRTAAHFTYVDECETENLHALRDRVKPYAEQAGVKLTFLPFIVKAVVAALKKHPALNCLIDDNTQEMVLKRSYDIGIATATDAGLMVPVLRAADRLSILEIAGEIERLADLARRAKIQKEDLGGSSFTITSMGKQGGLLATPVVNYPEVAILGVHAIKKRPVVRGNEIVIGEVMLLSLSFDHRIIDGHVGAAFAQQLITYLQEPDRLVADMA
jgi:pyruvate dehydrogenase E2 component (dihydrolipoamide acetyltransferase)